MLTLRAALLVSLLVGSPALAAAQGPAVDVAGMLDTSETPEDGDRLPDRGEANTLTHIGLSLTVSGLTTAALGVSLFVPSFIAWGIPGGTFAGLGGLLMMIGMPIWIAGGVRREVLSARPEDRGRVGNDYEIAGIVTTFVSLATSLVGAGLLLFVGNRAEGAASGLTLLPLGAGIAHFIGIPMWCEGARF